MAGLACYGQGGGANDPADREKITALSKVVLRDAAELPMEVAVTTVVTDAAGREKRHGQSSIRFVFHGYNQQAQRFTFDSRSGWFNTGALRDSQSGNFAVFEALSLLAPKNDSKEEFEIQWAGRELTIRRAVSRDCHGFTMRDGVLYPQEYCPSVEVRASSEAAGVLTLERFALDVGNLPGAGKIGYLGAVEVRRFHAEGELQKAYLRGDPQPFYIPKRVVTTIGTDRGNVVLTNVYTVAARSVPH